MNNVLESSMFVANNADNVKINFKNLSVLADEFVVQPESNWLDNSPFDINSLSDDERLMFCVVFNALSFSYWGEPYWNVEYLGTLHTRGSWSLVAAIFRSIAEKRSLLKVENLSKVTIDELRIILRGNTEIPLLNERVNILNCIGTTIDERFQGSFKNLIELSHYDTNELVSNIIQYFSPAFDDSYIYKRQKIFFNKRAQALVESIHSVFRGLDAGKLTGIDNLTALADYIIPNLLRNIGILSYSSDLSFLIDSNTLIDKGSAFEVEIRGCTIWAIEVLRIELAKRKKYLSSKVINDYMWTIGGNVKTPYHLTRTTAY